MQHRRRREEEVNTAAVVRAGAWRTIYKIKDSGLKGTLGTRLHDVATEITQGEEGKFK